MGIESPLDEIDIPSLVILGKCHLGWKVRIRNLAQTDKYLNLKTQTFSKLMPVQWNTQWEAGSEPPAGPEGTQASRVALVSSHCTLAPVLD